MGDIIREKYDTNFFFMDRYPLTIWPFYTIPDLNDPNLTNSYDFFIWGQEILLGAQHIYEPELILKRAKAWGIPAETISAYMESFWNCTLPHGGEGHQPGEDHHAGPLSAQHSEGEMVPVQPQVHFSVDENRCVPVLSSCIPAFT